MENSIKLLNRFREIFLDGTWVVYTNYQKFLSEISWETAQQKIENLNTIEALSFHIHYYIKGILDVFNGGTLSISDKYSFDFSPTNSEAEWKIFLNKFSEDCEKFSNFIQKMDDEDLSKDFSDNKYGSYEKNINAMIEHGYYHFGQMVLIKKMIEK